MNTQQVRLIALLTVLLTAFFTAPLLAATDFPDLINRAGMQRMLSQRIAKAYLCNPTDISKTEASHQIEMGLKRFEYNAVKLKTVEDQAVQQALAAIQTSFVTFKGLVMQPYNKENAATVLELSETILSSSHNIVLMLEDLSGAKVDRVINISGRQRMLSQRIALYYLAYHAGFHDANVVQQLKNAESEFTYALDMLQKEQSNTKEINMLLAKMKHLWSVVSSYLQNVEKEGNPILVFSTTDDLTNLADKVTTLYVEIADKK